MTSFPSTTTDQLMYIRLKVYSKICTFLICYPHVFLASVLAKHVLFLLWIKVFSFFSRISVLQTRFLYWSAKLLTIIGTGSVNSITPMTGHNPPIILPIKEAGCCASLPTVLTVNIPHIILSNNVQGGLLSFSFINTNIENRNA